MGARAGPTRFMVIKPRLPANEGQDLVAFLLHQSRRRRFEIEAQKRLGVGGAHVEMPVGETHRDAVDTFDPPVTVACSDRLDLGLAERPAKPGISRSTPLQSQSAL